MIDDKKIETFGLYSDIRFISSLLIVVFHIQNLTGIFINEDFKSSIFFTGDKAVAVFCILSSYLLCYNVKNIDCVKKLFRFYFNRILRLYPTFFLVILFIFLIQLQTLQPVPLDVFIKDALLFNLKSPNNTINPIFWTLHLDLLFYLFLPLFYHLFKDRNIAFFIFVFIIIVMIEIFFSTVSPGPYLSLIKFFFIGFAMSRFESKVVSIRPGGVSFLFLLGILFLYIDFHQYPFLTFMSSTLNEVYSFNLFFGLLFIFLVSLKFKNLSFFSINYSYTLGKISYGIYCWHFTIIALFFDMYFDGSGGIFVRQPILISNISLMYIPFLLIPFIIAGICNYYFLEKFFNRFRLKV